LLPEDGEPFPETLLLQQEGVTMARDCAFETPVFLAASSEPIRTVGQAVGVLQHHLEQQFTMARLTTLLILERAAEGTEIAEARQAFCAWASSEAIVRPVAAAPNGSGRRH
jgi:hypothetical protein